MRRLGTALGAGLLFGVGLAVSGMIDPRNVVGFLDVTGRWNPSLAAVMLGAIAAHAALLRLGGRRGWGPSGLRPSGPPADARLLGGAAIFGVGWGLSGYCPGPAIVALGFGPGRGLAFVAAMIAGTLLAERLAVGRG